MFWFKLEMCCERLYKSYSVLARVTVEAKSKKDAARQFEEIAEGLNQEDRENYYYLSPTIYGGESGYATKRAAENAAVDEPKPDFN